MGGLFSSNSSEAADHPPTSSSKLTTRDVVTALKTLAVSSTKELMFHLGVDLTDLDDIERQYNSDVKDQKRHFIDKWIEIDENASWDKLAVGLKKIDRKTLAYIIHSKHSSEYRETDDDIESNAKQYSPVQLKPVPMLVWPARPPRAERAILNESAPEMAAAPETMAAPVPIPPASPSIHSDLSQTRLQPSPTLVTAPPTDSTPTNSSAKSPTVNQDKVAAVRASIKHFKEEFTKLMCGIYIFLSEAVTRESSFLGMFRVVLLALPVSKKPIHRPFFLGKEKAILNAANIDELWAILNCYCDYKNYEIIMYIIEKYVKQEGILMQSMIDYHDSFVKFETSTTVDIYLCAIKIDRDSKLYRGFCRMVLKINKPACECTLHEIRQLKESIAESADIYSYGVYIDEPHSGSVVVVLRIPQSFLKLVTTIMTLEFQQAHNLTNVTVLSKYLKLKQVKYILMYSYVHTFLMILYHCQVLHVQYTLSNYPSFVKFLE